MTIRRAGNDGALNATGAGAAQLAKTRQQVTVTQSVRMTAVV